MNRRGWTTFDPNLEVDDQLSARATVLMDEWSRLHHEEEQEAFARQRAYEDGDDYDYDPRICDCGDDPNDPDELCSHDRDALTQAARSEALRLEGRQLRMELITQELAHHGLRPMRPYEHWNEEESYHEYMEVTRHGH